MKNNVYFKDVPNIGLLFLEQILFSYESIPIVFVCIDKYKYRYLCICDDVIDEKSWLITKINNIELSKILNDVSTVLSAFVGKEVIIANSDFNQNVRYNIMNYDSISKDELPICDQFLEMKDHLKSYIEKINNDILLVNLELHFSSLDVFNNELNISQSLSSFKGIIETELYGVLSEHVDINNVTEEFFDDSLVMRINCKSVCDKLNNLDNHSKETIAFAA